MEDSKYKTVNIVGSSEVSWAEAANNAVKKANETLKDLRIAEVVTKDLIVDEGETPIFRTRLRMSFRLVDI